MLKLNFNPFPVIETERLLLRKITLKDAHGLYYLRTHEEVMKYIDRPLSKSVEEVQKLIRKIEGSIRNNLAIAWAISMKNNRNIIGTIGYHRIERAHYRAEIGYLLHPLFWNKGIMSEAIKRILLFGFDTMKLHSIEANVNPANAQSIKLLLNHNFCKEAYFRENYFYGGNFLDTEIYSLLADSKNKT